MKYSPDYSSRFRILKGGKISLVVSALIASVTMLQAAPSGGVVTVGSANIAQNGSVTTITQSTNKAAINWQNFSIGKTETVNFNQPNVSSVTLNRVVGNEKSVIDGALNANGQVFILNSNGVLFSKNASINTAGLVATTMNLSDADFMNGNYAFKGDSQASIINQGTINISDKGYAALFGKEVKNEGFIKATLGKVELVGAKEVTLNLNGNSLVNLKVNKGVLDALVENKGAIYADGGEVYLTTNAVNELLKGVVNNTGIVEANSIDDITGKVELYAHGGALHVEGTIEAEGGFVETSGQSLHVEDSTIIKTKKWLLDPDNMTIQSGGGASLTGENVSATAVQNALSTADIELQATTNITVNENITWTTDKKLTLKAGDEIRVNATIENTNTTNGGVYFHAANTIDKVIFDANGKVIIHNVYQLQWMNTALGGNYILGSDIDASVTSSWGTKGWEPIVKVEGVGEYATYYGFTGTFDGLGHTISHLTINDSTRDKVGFFGQIDGATVQNVGLVGVNITGREYVGALAGISTGISTIANAYATGTVRGHMYIGGLVGQNDTSTIKNSYAVVNVEGTDIVGGLVATNGSSTIENSYASGTVTENCTYHGGLYGFAAGTITNSYYDNQANTTMTDTTLGKTKAQLLALVTGGTWNNTTIWGANGSAVEGYTTDAITLPFLRSVTKFGNTLFAGGFGTSANPYTITNWTQLQNINYNTDVLTNNYYFTLSNSINNATADYTALASSTANSGAGWNPIGDATNKFTGNFNGADYTIGNLFINRDTTLNIGLFGRTLNATLANIGVTNADITGRSQVGILAGWVDGGTVNNSYTSGTVKATIQTVGGLVGANQSTIDLSYSLAQVEGVSSYLGGLVGSNEGSIANSYATGKVVGTTAVYVGGLVGINTLLHTITNSYATGEVTGNTYVGGLVGQNNGYNYGVGTIERGTIANSYATGKVTGVTNVGGLVGENLGDIKTSYAIGEVSAGTNVGGLVGSNTYAEYMGETTTGTIDTVSFWDTDTSKKETSAGGVGKTTAQMMNASTYTGWLTTIWSFVDGSTVAGYALGGLPYLKNVTRSQDIVTNSETLFAGGMGINGNPYTITNWTQLQNINYNTATLNKYFTLSNNIDNTTAGYTNSGAGFVPIGNNSNKFSGTFDGLGHTITGLFIDRPTMALVGLFGFTNGATIRNIGIVNANITGDGLTGGLAGYAYTGTTITNAYTAGGRVTGSSYSVGGLVGAIDGSTITSSYATADVIGGGNDVGGLVGAAYHTSTITNSYATGSVKGVGSVGGLVGELLQLSTITNSYATGSVTGVSSVGGLLGAFSGGGAVTNSYWDTQTSGQPTYSARGIGKTTEEMKTLSTYTGWNITGTDGAYPTLTLGGVTVWTMSPPPLIGLSYTLSTQNHTYNGSIYNLTDFWSASSIFGASYASWVLGTDYTFIYSGNSTTGFKNAGTYSNITIDILKSGYTEASSGNTVGALTIDKKALTISGLSADNKTYDGLLTATINTAGVTKTGLIDGDALTVSSTGVFADKNAGTGKTVTLTNTYAGADKDNYTITDQTTTTANITPASLTVTANNASKTYDGSVYSGGNGVSYGGFVNNETASVLSGSLSYGGDSQSATNAGSYVITPSGLSSGNYTLSFANGALTITKANATVTANSESKTYNGTSQSITGYTVSGLVNGENASVLDSVTLSGSGTNVGTYTISGTGSDNNYNLSFANGALTITKANATVTANSDTKTYNGTSQSITGYTVSGLVNDETASVLDSVTLSGSGTNVGTYTISGTGSDNNYELSFANGALTITKASLTVTANNASKTHDGLAYSGGNGVSYSGFVNNETASVLSGNLSYGGDSQNAINAGSYVITASGLDSGNYTLSYVDGILTIEASLAPTQDITPIITQIINGTAITPPVIPTFTPPTSPAQAPQQFNVGGARVQLASVPSGDTPSQLVGTQEARAMIQGGEVGELRIPLGQNSGIQLVNGGVHLPEGLEQEFFMAQR